VLAQRSTAFLPRLFATRREREVNVRLDELLELAPRNDALEDYVFWFVGLSAWLRPRGTQDSRTRVRFLRTHLELHPERKATLRAALSQLARRVDLTTFLAYGGIPRDFHLFGAISGWLAGRVLPTPCRTDDIEQIVWLAFREDDLGWLESSGVVALLSELLEPEVFEKFRRAAADAALDLVHQIAAQAHGPSIRKLASEPRSPFRGLYDAVAAFVATPNDTSLFKSVRGRIAQCQRAREELRGTLAKRGADLNTTFLLMRIQRQLERLDLLAVGLHDGESAANRIVTRLTRRALRNSRAAHLVTRSSELVVRNMVDTTASVGNDYLDERTSSFRAAFLAGAGGGLLMVIATFAKFGLHSLHLPPIYEGVAFSLNYAAAFVGAYLLHFTIATKLPAHTAAALARSAQGEGTRRDKVAAAADALRALVRLQLGGLVGNLIVAGPLAYGIAWLVHSRTGSPVLSPAVADHALDANSLLGPSFLFAALTGVFLWMSSLGGAAVDNWARVNRVGTALATGLPAMKSVGAQRAEPKANAIASRIGGLFGNAFLGVLLGAVPALFAVVQLPVEIRHVTVSTSSVAIAITTGSASQSEIVLAVTGVLLIGLVNVVVSFALALALAFRASDDPDKSRVLVRLGLRRLFRARA
jgi:site-specific recombinase